MRTCYPSILSCILFLLPVFGLSQTVIINDDFEDGDFTTSPAWTGDTDHFTIAEEAGNGLLKLDAGGAGDSFLGLPSPVAYGSWEFFVRFDFSTLSGSNNLTVFLTADNPDPAGGITGYALSAGRSGSGDVFEIVRYEMGSPAATVLSGSTVINDGGGYRVKIDRDSGGGWTLSVASGYGSIPEIEAAGIDNSIRRSSYFGFHPIYTSTRADKFFFDDVVITKLPLGLTAVEAIDNRMLVVHFTDDLDPASVAPTDFAIDRGIGPPGRVAIADHTATIIYETPIPGGSYTLTVNGIDDLAGTTIPANSGIGFTLFDLVSTGDVIINEFMYDEPPGLSEYVEILNTSSKRFNLAGWQLGDINDPQVISFDTLVLDAGAYLVISSDTSSLFNTFGAQNYLEMPGFPALNNSPGDAIRIRTDSGIPVDSLLYDTQWGGEEVALERRSPTAPSYFSENWDISPAPSGGTPGRVNEVEQDTVAPAIWGFRIIDPATLALRFSERLDEKSATDLSGFTLNNSARIGSLRFQEPDSVQLILETPLRHTNSYLLTVTGVGDIFGNSIPKEEIPFTFYEISEADSGDVFLNEFMFDPPDGLTEFIELYNPTEKAFDLHDWTLRDNTGTSKSITRNRYILPPESYVVIGPDSTLAAGRPDLRLLTMGSRFPVLNNGGDDIVVRSAAGLLLDSLRYAPSWGGEGSALGRRSTQVTGTYRENWSESPQESGSPGSANGIAPDQTAPAFLALNIINTTTLQLVFSETVEPGSAVSPANYRLVPDSEIENITAKADTVLLFLADPLESGRTYEVTVRHIKDIFGNQMAEASRAFRYLKFSPARKGDVVINEILYRKSPEGGPQFVELYNRSESNIDLTRWWLGDSSDSCELGEGVRLESRAFLVLTDDRQLASSINNGYYLPAFPSLNQTGDAVYIRSDQHVTIDSLYYSHDWGGRAGVSIERIDPEGASGDSSNWSPSTSPAGMSAGRQNTTYSPDQAAPDILFATLRPEGRIEVRFNEFVKLNSGVRFLLDGVDLEIESFNPDRANIVFLDHLPKNPGISATETYLAVRNLPDVKGNIAPSVSIPLARPLEKGSVVINEIMFRPLNDPDDNKPDQGEYLEVRNIRDHAISLEGFYLHDAPDERGRLRSLFPVSTVSRWIPPHSHLLIHADTAEAFADSKTASFFGLAGSAGAPVYVIRINRSSLGLAAVGDAIFLSDSSGATIDSVFYDENWHNPNIPDTRGVALERIHPESPGNEPSNWGSSTAPKGGTPGSKNSLYQLPGHTPAETGISFDPNPFSPDDDGFEDNLFINYRLDRSGYLLRVRIFDRYGRLVRNLADGRPAGFEGSLIWDGRTDEGNKNRIGIYIVLFEAIDGNQGSRKAFKELVVLARRF